MIIVIIFLTIIIIFSFVVLLVEFTTRSTISYANCEQNKKKLPPENHSKLQELLNH